MPAWLTEIMKVVGFSTPLLYAGATYGLFHWLDKKASAAAKAAISSLLQLRQYKNDEIGNAIIELFNRIYTSNLLSWDAFARSALFTLCMNVIFVYESLPSNNKIRFFDELQLPIDFITLGATVTTNVISDYVSLFAVKRLLILGKNRPFVALWVGAAAGMSIVAFFNFVLNIGLALWVLLPEILRSTNNAPLDLLRSFISFSLANFSGTFNLPVWFALFVSAFVVHLWLPLFFICAGAFRGLNYLRVAIGWTQWFIKQGRQHPLEAIGYVAAVIVFVCSAIIQRI
jgi:hypothetical protein